MEKRSTYAPKALSGINVIDEAWGGLYRGGTYLVYGQAWSGRSLFTLQFTATGVSQQERCLYIFSERPGDLVIQAAAIHFNLRGAADQGLVKLMRIPLSFKPEDMNDEDLHDALMDLVDVIMEEKPDRLIIDNFTKFAGFSSVEAFDKSFTEILDRLELVNTTMILGLGEPVNANAKEIVERIARQVTGTVHISNNNDDPYASARFVTIVPNIGHLEGAVADYWDVGAMIEHNEAQQAFIDPQPIAVLPPVPEPTPTPAPPVPEPIQIPEMPVIDLAEELTPEVQPVAIPEVQEPVFTADHPTGKAEEVVDFNPIVLPPNMPPPRRLSELPGKQHVFNAPPSIPTPAPPSVPVVAEVPELSVPGFERLEAVESTSSSVKDDGVPMRDFTDVTAFATLLDEEFKRRDQDGTPFILIAMRMDKRENRKARPFDFEFILDLVTESLQETDHLLVNPEKERLVILRTSPKKDAQNFFSELMEKLRAEAPQQAEQMLRSVSAIVVPDGKPFKNAQEFLAYAMDRI